MKGVDAKKENKSDENLEDNQELISETSNENDQLSDELIKLNQLLKDGVLTQEEFEKAKKKILDN